MDRIFSHIVIILDILNDHTIQKNYLIKIGFEGKKNGFIDPLFLLK